MNPQQPGVDAAHLHAAQSPPTDHKHACRDNIHTDPPVSRLLCKHPIELAPARSLIAYDH